jgi:hypothetical protein
VSTCRDREKKKKIEEHLYGPFSEILAGFEFGKRIKNLINHTLTLSNELALAYVYRIIGCPAKAKACL